MNSKKVVMAAAATALAGMALGTGSNASAAPSTEYCLDQTRLVSMSTTGGPFDGGTRISWNVSKGCSTVGLTLGGAPIGASGTTTKDPDVTTKYVVTAHLNGQSRNLGSKIAVGGDVVEYASHWTGPIAQRDVNGPGSAEARAFAAPVVNALGVVGRNGLLGKKISIHLIPTHLQLTHLPPWRYLAGTSTCDGQPETCVEDRPWVEVRGVGGRVLAGTNEIAFAAGVDTVTATPRGSAVEYGHILVHELGHTLLDHAAPAKEPTLQGLLDTRLQDDTARYPGKDVYTKSNVDEYWAEGVAALYGLGGPRVITASWQRVLVEEYSEAWLAEHDPALLTQLNLVFPHRG